MSLGVVPTYTTCWSCGGSYPLGGSHDCAGISSGLPWGIPEDIAKEAKKVTLKKVVWSEYTPANPPEQDQDYLIVYINRLTGKKETEIARFRITEYHEYQWYSPEDELTITATVTHIMKIDLP